MAKRKQRVRKHELADLSANHVGYHVYKAGFTIEAPIHDYGTDGLVTTFDASGYQENGLITLQFKATDTPHRYEIQDGYSYPISLGDLEQWNDELYPVYLVFFDAKNEKAFWVEIQSYLKGVNLDPSTASGKTHNVHLPLANVVTTKTPLVWQTRKNGIVKKLLKELKK